MVSMMNTRRLVPAADCLIRSHVCNGDRIWGQGKGFRVRGAGGFPSGSLSVVIVVREVLWDQGNLGTFRWDLAVVMVFGIRGYRIGV